MKICFGTVVYQAAEKYLDDFFASLSKQTFNDFDILVINDDIKSLNLPGCRVVDTNGSFSPLELRLLMFKEAKAQGYDLLIFGDCDDMASVNRVEGYAKAWNPDYDFFYNSVVTFNGIVILEPMPKTVSDFREIGEKNFLGMGNSGFNLHSLSEGFIDSLSGGKTVIFDWYLFSRLLLDGKCGKKTECGETIYRIHEGNVAGITDDAERELEIKKRHYALLKEYDSYYSRLEEEYKNLEYKETTAKKSPYWWGIIQLGGNENEI